MSAAMAEGWSRELATEVSVRLDVLDQVAAGVADVRVDPDQVRSEIRALVASWRHLLELHTPDERDGSCPRCSGWRRRRWPCPVWQAAHKVLITRTDLRPAEEPPPAPVPAPPSSAPTWQTDPSLSMPLRVRLPVPAQPHLTVCTTHAPAAAAERTPAAAPPPTSAPSRGAASGTPGPASPSIPAEVGVGGAGPRFHDTDVLAPVAADDPPPGACQVQDRNGKPGPASPPRHPEVVEAGPGPLLTEAEVLAYGRHAFRGGDR